MIGVAFGTRPVTGTTFNTEKVLPSPVGHERKWYIGFNVHHNQNSVERKVSAVCNANFSVFKIRANIKSLERKQVTKDDVAHRICPQNVGDSEGVRLPQ